MRGHALQDRRTDIYSFGVIAFEALTGRLPFEATDPAGLIAEKLSGFDKPQDDRLARQAPAVLQLIGQCLSRSPDDRPGTAAELERRVLAAANAAPTTVAPGAARPSTFVAAGTPAAQPPVSGGPGTRTAMLQLVSRNRAALLAAFALVGLVAVVTFALVRRSRPESPTDTRPTQQRSAAPAVSDLTEPAAPRILASSAPDAGAAPAPVIPPVVVWVRSRPPGADVRIAGRKLGRTPVRLLLSRAGLPVTASLHKPGYAIAYRVHSDDWQHPARAFRNSLLGDRG